MSGEQGTTSAEEFERRLKLLNGRIARAYAEKDAAEAEGWSSNLGSFIQGLEAANSIMRGTHGGGYGE